MPLTAEPRLTNLHLNEINARLMGQLNEEGLRAWYYSDVGALIREVLAQRRIMAQALEVCRDNPALEHEPQDLLEAVRAIRERWSELKRGVWARAEIKKLRDTHEKALESLAQLQEHLRAEMARGDALRAEIDQLNARLVDVIAAEKVASQIAAEGKAALAGEQAKTSERLARVESLLTQASIALHD